MDMLIKDLESRESLLPEGVMDTVYGIQVVSHFTLQLSVIIFCSDVVSCYFLPFRMLPTLH